MLFSRSDSIVEGSNNITEAIDNEALRGLEGLQEAARRDIGDNRISLSKSVSINQFARDGGGRGEGAAKSFQLE